MRIASRDSWKTQPMPQQVTILDYDAEFTHKEFERISTGLIPKEMENKWFIFLEENILNFHRSWTGYCIYRVEFEQHEGKHLINVAEANRDPEQYTETNDDADAKLLHFLICNLLLGQQKPFPAPAGTPKGVVQLHVAGTLYPEKETSHKPWWKFWK